MPGTRIPSGTGKALLPTPFITFPYQIRSAAWMTDSQAAHIYAAAECADFRATNFVYDTAAAAASQGLDLCCVASDYVPCRNQGQLIMAFNLSDNGLVMASHYISHRPYLEHPRAYRITHHLDDRPSKGDKRDDLMGMIDGEMIIWELDW